MAGDKKTDNCQRIRALTTFCLCRHPSSHEYYDPNDYMGDIHQDMDREELELEVGTIAAS